ncbi:MAG: LysR family transcriptional regulator [Hydrocarboniphaga sp.]|uniref:LysR family transcriptional regulator n=1 Tax=Hydrocarboniphaga sp. TaxID=2033016 RepID=UPI00260D0417|nr:LysR family transcriptional regulator [Hydrocarboniphaga sp.]MDB5971009.1 LysR family transcriptional regulator [Hydrocarboniphaga sp.]
MDQLDDLRIYVATVNAQSFTAAAGRLGLSKQFVSRRVGTLEARLGVRLLLRTTRKLSVTDLGRDYYERARLILEQVDDADRAVSSQNLQPRGKLRISAPMSFGTLHLSPLLPLFLQRNPEVSVELDLSDRLVDVVGEGYDVAVRIALLADSSLIARTVTPVQPYVCASPDYLRQRGTPLTPADIRGHDCLLYGHSPSVEWVFVDGSGKRIAIPVQGQLRANNGELGRDAAIAGLGLTLLPDFIVGNALKDGRLVSVLDAWMPPPGAVYVVYPAHRQTSSAVRAFADFLVETFQAK